MPYGTPLRPPVRLNAGNYPDQIGAGLVLVAVGRYVPHRNFIALSYRLATHLPGVTGRSLICEIYRLIRFEATVVLPGKIVIRRLHLAALMRPMKWQPD